MFGFFFCNIFCHSLCFTVWLCGHWFHFLFFLQDVCVQYERCVQVSFFTRSQHCDNEFIWKYTLRAACACGLMLVFAHVCLFTHSVYMWLKLSRAPSYVYVYVYVCVCVMGTCVPENVCA